MPISISVSLGHLDAGDIGAAREAVTVENERRADQGRPRLPADTDEQLVRSYKLLLTEMLRRSHSSYLRKQSANSARLNAAELWQLATDSHRAAAIKVLSD